MPAAQFHARAAG